MKNKLKIILKMMGNIIEKIVIYFVIKIFD